MTMRLPTGHQQPRLTATIERYQVRGTPRHELRVMYRGAVLRWWNNGAHVFAIVQDNPSRSSIHESPADIEACKAHTKRMGFTHVRFVGDWFKRTQPAGGKL